MSDDERLFRHESLQDPVSLGAHLRALGDAVASGVIRLTDDEGTIVLEPHGLVGLDVRAVRKRDKVRVTVRLSWKDQTAASTDTGGLRIGGNGNGSARS